MRREDAYHVTIDALSKMQWNVAVILESKASEAEKVRNWLVANLNAEAFPVQTDRLSICLQLHEQHIELIDGLTKMCNGLSRNMKMILNPDDGGSSDGMSAGYEGFGGGERG